MQMRHLALFGLVALTLAAPAQADLGPYFGFKAGFMDADASNHKDALNIGALFGYRFFDEPHGSGSMEGEVTTTVKEGERNGRNDEWRATTVAMFFAYRTAGEVFLKAKAGFAEQDARGTSEVPDETGVAFGFGVGWQASRKANVEVEYTVFDELEFVSLGFNTRF